MRHIFILIILIVISVSSAIAGELIAEDKAVWQDTLRRKDTSTTQQRDPISLGRSGAMRRDSTVTNTNSDFSISKMRIGIGFGGAYAFDKDMFNSKQAKIKAEPEFSFLFIAGDEMRENLFVALFAEGWTQSLGTVNVRHTNGRFKDEELSFIQATLGVLGRYFLLDHIFKPYVTASLGAQYGMLFVPEESERMARGMLLGAGIGICLEPFKGFQISAEGMLHLGFSTWDDYPLFDSDGLAFNPNYMSSIFMASYRF